MRLKALKDRIATLPESEIAYIAKAHTSAPGTAKAIDFEGRTVMAGDLKGLVASHNRLIKIAKAYDDEFNTNTALDEAE